MVRHFLPVTNLPSFTTQVRARLGFLKERLTRTINLVLDAESQPPPHGRWRSVWEKARAFVTRQDQDAALQHKLVRHASDGVSALAGPCCGSDISSAASRACTIASCTLRSHLLLYDLRR